MVFLLVFTIIHQSKKEQLLGAQIQHNQKTKRGSKILKKKEPKQLISMEHMSKEKLIIDGGEHLFFWLKVILCGWSK